MYDWEGIKKNLKSVDNFRCGCGDTVEFLLADFSNARTCGIQVKICNNCSKKFKITASIGEFQVVPVTW